MNKNNTNPTKTGNFYKFSCSFHSRTIVAHHKEKHDKLKVIIVRIHVAAIDEWQQKTMTKNTQNKINTKQVKC